MQEQRNDDRIANREQYIWSCTESDRNVTTEDKEYARIKKSTLSNSASLRRETHVDETEFAAPYDFFKNPKRKSA